MKTFHMCTKIYFLNKYIRPWNAYSLFCPLLNFKHRQKFQAVTDTDRSYCLHNLHPTIVSPSPTGATYTHAIPRAGKRLPKLAGGLGTWLQSWLQRCSSFTRTFMDERTYKSSLSNRLQLQVLQLPSRED
jgi:hypothetical protein